MSCCGQTAVQALAAAQQTLDARTAALTHVRLVYTGPDKRVQPFVAAGKVYQFGNNERRRTNVVAAAAVQKLMATGLFEVFDPERHNEDGSLKVVTSDQLAVSSEHQSAQPAEASQTGAEARQGENLPAVPATPASAPAAQPAAPVRTSPKARKR